MKQFAYINIIELISDMLKCIYFNLNITFHSEISNQCYPKFSVKNQFLDQFTTQERNYYLEKKKKLLLCS